MKLAFLNYEPCGKEGELYYQLKRGWSCSTKKSKYLRVEYPTLLAGSGIVVWLIILTV